MTWSFVSNSDSLLEKFDSLVNEDVTSKGSWKEDFDSLSEKYGLVTCPFITCSVSQGEQNEACRVANGKIDLSSWRVMLLALSTVGSKVTELYVHNTTLRAEHIQDLAKALKKSCVCKSVRLQYVDLEQLSNESTDDDGSTSNAMTDAFKSLFSDETCVEYISLKGSKIDDKIMTHVAAAIGGNQKLTSLNLSDNALSDESVIELIKTLRFNTSLRQLSFASNRAITGSCFQHFNDILFLGSVASADEEAALKAAAKTLGDKNKHIKDLNKKRKKAGWAADVPEIAAATECSIKRDAGVWIINRSLRYVDFSLIGNLQIKDATVQATKEEGDTETASAAAATTTTTDSAAAAGGDSGGAAASAVLYHGISAVKQFVQQIQESDDGAALSPAATMGTAEQAGDNDDTAADVSFGGVTLALKGYGWVDTEDEDDCEAEDQVEVAAAHESAAAGGIEQINCSPKAWMRVLL